VTPERDATTATTAPATEAGPRPRSRRRARFLPSLAALVAACAPSAEPPSILLISIDTLRSDHVSAYGYERATTPRIDELAAEGALYLNAVSTSNWTLPSHMSLMTGLSPSLHRVEDEGSRLPATLRTLGEVLHESGYATAGITSHVFLGEAFGFARGFDHYGTQWNQLAERVTDRAIDWLDEHDGGPSFVFLHYFDPHWSYDAPEPFASRFGPADASYGDIDYLKHHFDPAAPLPAEALDDILRLYDAEIAYTDHHIGRLFDWLRERGRLDRTIVAIVADHGEEFLDHGGFGHGTHLHGEVTRVPFVLRYPPGIAPGRRERLATLADVPHTLLRLAGLPVPEQFRLRGVDLEAAPAEGAERLAIMESTRWGPKRFAVQGSALKLLTAGSYSPAIPDEEDGRKVLRRFGPCPLEEALYDVASDPAERENLLARAPRGAAGEALERALTSFLERVPEVVKLTLEGGDAAGGYSVRLRPDAGLVDEPFCPDPRVVYAAPGSAPAETDGTDGGPLPPEASLTVLAGAEPVTLYLPLDERSRELFVHVARDGGEAYEATVALPAAGESAVVPFAGDGAPRCVVARAIPELEASFEALDLAEEDLEHLRALGYVR
jgi:arylsulfatase A-like enzyme